MLKTMVLIIVVLFISFPIWGILLAVLSASFQKAREDGKSIIVSIIKVAIVFIAILAAFEILSLISDETGWLRPGFF